MTGVFLISCRLLCLKTERIKAKSKSYFVLFGPIKLWQDEQNV